MRTLTRERGRQKCVTLHTICRFPFMNMCSTRNSLRKYWTIYNPEGDNCVSSLQVTLAARPPRDSCDRKLTDALTLRGFIQEKLI
jgi:hypothetical protein